MTREYFMQTYATALKARWTWANDATKLTAYLAEVRKTLEGELTWTPEGAALTDAWQSIGMKGKPTLKALRALPAAEA